MKRSGKDFNLLSLGFRRFKGFLNFLWNDHSFESWMVNLLIAFLVIKFLVFPVLVNITDSGTPVASIVSDSMEHHPSHFFDWWINEGGKYEEFEIGRDDFGGFHHSNGLNIGDLIFVGRPPTCDYDVGDVIVFSAGANMPVIHRIVDIWEDDRKHYFRTLGDNNPGSLSLELNISEDNVQGRVIGRVPWIGNIKVIFLKLTQSVF